MLTKEQRENLREECFIKDPPEWVDDKYVLGKAVRKYVETLKLHIPALLDSLDELEADRDNWKSRAEMLVDSVAAYQSDLLRTSDRHEMFVSHLINTYQCPPTQTANTCYGKDNYCRYCWCKWAETESEQCVASTGGDSGE